MGGSTLPHGDTPCSGPGDGSRPSPSAPPPAEAAGAGERDGGLGLPPEAYPPADTTASALADTGRSTSLARGSAGVPVADTSRLSGRFTPLSACGSGKGVR